MRALILSVLALLAPAAPSAGQLARPPLAQVEPIPVTKAVAAGETVPLVVRVRPRAGIHVYAPEETRYRPVVLSIEKHAQVAADKPVFPDPVWSTFAGERVRVYDAAFEIRQPVRLAAGSKGTVVVRGILEYQACDDLMCYLPVKVPVRWDLSVR